MKTVEKAKVVASVWVKEFIQFLAPLTVLPRTTLKNGMNSSFSFNHPGGTHPIIQKRPRQNSQRGKELNKLFPPPPKQKRRSFPYLLSLLLCHPDFLIVHTNSGLYR